jgi:hypothetical protein
MSATLSKVVVGLISNSLSSNSLLSFSPAISFLAMDIAGAFYKQKVISRCARKVAFSL